MDTENWKRKLRCGDVLTLRNGDKLFYLGYGDFDDGTTTDNYNENLQFINSFGIPIDSDFDIILIERPMIKMREDFYNFIKNYIEEKEYEITELKDEYDFEDIIGEARNALLNSITDIVEEICWQIKQAYEEDNSKWEKIFQRVKEEIKKQKGDDIKWKKKTL